MEMKNEVSAQFLSGLFQKEKVMIAPQITEYDMANFPASCTHVAIVAHPLNAAEHEQLMKIIKSCRIDEANFTLIDEPVSWLQLRTNEALQYIFLFGLAEDALGISINFPTHHVVPFDNRNWIKTASISDLMHNTPLKNELWTNALRPHFVGS